MIPCLGRCRKDLEPGSGKTGGAGWDRVARKTEIRKTGGFESHCECHSFFSSSPFVLLFHFLLFLVLLKHVIFFCLCCIKHYSPITIMHVLLSNLSQVYVELNSQVLYEFKLTQFHVYKAYNLSLLVFRFYVLFEYNLHINAVNCNSLRCIKLKENEKYI